MADQVYTVVFQLASDGVVDPHGFPPEVNVRASSSGRTELVLHIAADDPIDALSRAEYEIDAQPVAVATVLVMPRREFLHDNEGPLPILVTVPEAAIRLEVSQQRIRQLIEGGALQATKVGRDWVIRESDLGKVPYGKQRMDAHEQVVGHSA